MGCVKLDVWAWIDLIHRVRYVQSGYPRNPIKADLIILIEFADTLIISFYSFYGPGWLCCQHLLIEGITFPGSAIMLFIKRNTGQSEWASELCPEPSGQLSAETSLFIRDWALSPSTNRVGREEAGLTPLWYVNNNLLFTHMKGQF